MTQLSFNAAASSPQNTERFHEHIFYRTWENYFGPFRGPFDAKSSKQKFSPKSSQFVFMFMEHFFVFSWNKSETCHAKSVDKTWETSFWAPLGPLLTQKWQIFLSKMPHYSISRLYCNYKNKYKKSSEREFFIELGEPHFAPILAPFAPKISKQKI